MAPYRTLFDDVSPFWAERDRLMSAWRRATTAAALRSGGSASGEAIGRDLAARGAPLKISVTGLCMLADAPRILEQLDGCLDHALTGMVLYDHFVDWREDVAAGRWNAFVEHVSARGVSVPEGRRRPPMSRWRCFPRTRYPRTSTRFEGSFWLGWSWRSRPESVAWSTIWPESNVSWTHRVARLRPAIWRSVGARSDSSSGVIQFRRRKPRRNE